eukprot:gene5244-6067_t
MEVFMLAIFVLLMLEMLICTIAMLPIPMSTRKSIFGGLNRVMQGHNARIVFKVVFVILLGMFADAIVNSISTDKKIHSNNDKGDLHERNQLYLRLFRYQRNIYLTGFTLYLFFVIYRAQSIVLELTSMENKSTAVMKQAQNNLNETDRLIKSNKELDDEVKSLKKMEKEYKAMKSQAESTSREYDRLKKEYDAVVGAKPKGQKKDD